MLVNDVRPGRHRRERAPVRSVVDSGARALLAWLTAHHLPLATASGLVVLGVIANLLAALMWGLLSRPDVVWVFAGSGIGAWLFAAALLCIFPPTAAARHKKGR